MKRVLLLTALAGMPVLGATWAAPALAQRGAQTESLTLTVGETKAIPAGGIREFATGAGGVVEVTATAEKLVVRAVKQGNTTLTVFKTDGSQIRYDIAVAIRSPEVVERELQDLIQGMSGSLRTRRVGVKIFVEGNVLAEGDLKRVQQIASNYGGQVESLVVLGPGERKLLIRLDFFFVQYEKSSGYNVGLGWPSSIGGVDATGRSVVTSNLNVDFITQTTTTANASIINQPLPRLDIAARHGWAKVTKQSAVITANGNEATFQNGGEQNFLQNVGLTTSLISVKFGTNVTVLPRYDSATRDVDIKLQADVADLTAPVVSGGPPGRTTTRLETQVTLKLGQALVLSGIKTASQRRNTAGIPGLSEIPVLGLLFSSQAQEKNETEGAVFIVPSVVDSVPKSALELIDNAMATYKEYSGDMKSVSTFPKPPPSAK